MSKTLRQEIEALLADFTRTEGYADNVVRGGQLVETLQHILDTTPDHRFFEDGKAHALLNKALCGQRATFPAPDVVGATAEGCAECTAALARLP